MSKLTTISLTDELRSKIDTYNKSNSEKIEISKLSRWAIKLFFASEGKLSDKKFDEMIEKLKIHVEIYQENHAENESEKLLKNTIEDLKDFLDLLGTKYTFENEDVCRKNKNSAKYWYDKGITFQTQNRMEEALDAYNHAIEIDPNNEYAWYNKGEVLEELWEFDDAIEAYIKVSDINPNNADAWFSQGFLDCCEHKAYSSAINTFNQALKILPNHIPSLYYKGFALSEQNQIEEAIECFLKACDLEPEHLIAKHDAEKLIDEICQTPNAPKILQNLLNNFPDNVIILTFMGRYFYHTEKNYEKALEVYEKILKIDEINQNAIMYKENIIQLLNIRK